MHEQKLTEMNKEKKAVRNMIYLILTNFKPDLNREKIKLYTTVFILR